MEFHENIAISLHLQDLTLLCKQHSELQNIELYNHPQLGKVLIINDEIQHIEKYQHLYHEPLIHIPMAFIYKPERCLVIGGGSLFAAQEILKYPSIKQVTLCDYDHNVLDLMCKVYPHAQKVIKDSRFKYIEQDALKFIDNTNEKYDLIINDCFNLAEKSVGVSLYNKLESLCSVNGVCADVIYRHIFDKETTQKSLNLLKKQSNLALSLTIIPDYPGILHLLTIWGKNTNIKQLNPKTINGFQLNTKNAKQFEIFIPNKLKYYFYLPPYITKILSQELF